MDDKKVQQNESIKDGLEKFIDQQMFGLDDIEKQRNVPKRQDSYYERPARRQMSDDERPARRQMSDDERPARRQMSDDERPARRQMSDDERPVRRQMSDNERPVRRQMSDDERPARRQMSDDERSVRKQTTKADHENTRSSKRALFEEELEDDWEKRNQRNRKKQKAKKPVKKAQKKKGGKKKKPMSKWKKVLCILLVVLLALLIWWYVMVVSVYQKMNYEKAEDIKGGMKSEGVSNILLIGNDSRENGDDGRSDAMILVSISDKTKTIYMTSLLRDMYVEIPGHDGNRLNAAYSYGGPALLCETIEQNFGIEINRYAIVNFQAFAKMVDAVGGVDLELTNEEVGWVNAYLNEYNLLEGRELTTDYLDTSMSGLLHLNGPQALAYCRNRYIGTDFERTNRQRKVLSAISKKLPLTMATNSSELVDGLFPNLTTNMKQTEVYGLSLNAAKYMSYDVEQMAIPAEGTYSNATIRKMMVLQVDFEANKKIIREQIYGEKEKEDDF